MTIMSFLLLIILFLAFFIYFSGLNPQDLTIFYLPGESFTQSAAIIVVSAILLGLAIGYLAHLYGTVSHMVKHWKRDRTEKRTREVAAIYREGVGRLLAGDVKKAHLLLQKALDRDPSRVETLIAMASVHLQEGESQEGLNLLLKAKSMDPKSLEVLFKLATTYEEMGRDPEAAKVYEEIIAVENGNRKAIRGLRDLHIKHGRWEEALDMQKKLLKAGPTRHRLEEEKQKLLYLRYEVARDVLNAGKIEEAASEFREIIKEAPSFTPARISLGDAVAALDRPEEAAQIWQEGYTTLGKAVFLARLEDFYLESEDPSTLLSFHRSLLLERGDDLMLRLFYGKLCLRLEMVEEAMEQLHAIESAGVDIPQLHVLLAEAHRRRNRLNESIREYKKALEVDRRLGLGYTCESCGASSEEWQTRCPACGTWGSYVLAGGKVIRNARLVEMRAIHHGEREEWNED